MRLLVGLVDAARGVDAAGDGRASRRPSLAFVERDALDDPAFAALVLALPSEADIAQEIGRDVDPDAVHDARRALRRRIGERCRPALVGPARRPRGETGRTAPTRRAPAGARLRNAALDLIAGGGCGGAASGSRPRSSTAPPT